LIQQELEDVLAEKIIKQDIEKGDKVLVKADKNGLLVDVKKQAEVKVRKK
jgi:ATP-dependent Clp protease ATP-binding subunit ClpA